MRINWEYAYGLVKKYYEHYGNLRISQNFKTKNGIEFDETGINLGTWLSNQKTKHRQGKLTSEQIEKLKELGIDLQNTHVLRWNMMYNLAKNYYNHYGNLKVGQSFKTKNGYTYDETGYNLGVWLNDQRRCYKNNKLSVERIKKLEQIEMFFEDVCAKEWERMYNLAKKYYEHYGTLKMSRDFKTQDGYTYNENGSCLPIWLCTQRMLYKKNALSIEYINKLEQIGIVFSIRKNKEENQKICEENGIDYKKNKRLVDSMTTREFISKINYLISQGASLTDKGILHPIFSMGTINMEVRYGINLETLISQYFDLESKIKKH